MKYNVGNILTGTADYYDVEDDAAGTHLHKWQTATSNAGAGAADISGETTETITLKASAATKHIAYLRTPVALTGNTPGLEVSSGWTNQPVAMHSNEFLYDQKFIIDNQYADAQVVGEVHLFSQPDDLADGSETFAITSDASGDFEINSSTGIITIKSGASLTVGTHSVTVAGTLDNYIDDTCTISIEVYTLGDEFYVDTVTGLDTDNGTTEALAKKTVAAGVALLSAGDKLWVKAGTYSSEGTINTPSGTSGNYVMIEGYKTTPGD